MFVFVERYTLAPYVVSSGGRTWYMARTADLEGVFQKEAVLCDGPPELAYGYLADMTALRGDFDNAKGLRDMGLLLLRAHRIEMALDTLRKAIHAKRPPNDAWYYLGECALRAGDRVAAQEAWETCLQKCRSKKSALAERCTQRMDEIFPVEP